MLNQRSTKNLSKQEQGFDHSPYTIKDVEKESEKPSQTTPIKLIPLHPQDITRAVDQTFSFDFKKEANASTLAMPHLQQYFVRQVPTERKKSVKKKNRPVNSQMLLNTVSPSNSVLPTTVNLNTDLIPTLDQEERNNQVVHPQPSQPTLTAPESPGLRKKEGKAKKTPDSPLKNQEFPQVQIKRNKLRDSLPQSSQQQEKSPSEIQKLYPQFVIKDDETPKDPQRGSSHILVRGKQVSPVSFHNVMQAQFNDHSPATPGEPSVVAHQVSIANAATHSQDYDSNSVSAQKMNKANLNKQRNKPPEAVVKEADID